MYKFNSTKKSILVLLFTFVSISIFAAPYILTGDSVEIIHNTSDKANYYVKIFTHRNTDMYEVDIDVWPMKASVIGSFTAKDGTIDYFNSGLYKNNSISYYCEDTSRIELTINKINDDTCEVTAYIQASRKNVLYSYQINTFRFAYKTGDVPPDPTEDPYRFEPEQPVSQAFNGQIVAVKDKREETGWINITLSDSLNQKWDWIELDLVSDNFDMPVGTFTFSADSAKGTFIASPGYRSRNDYPSYIAIRGNEWGQYTPYYIKSGSLTFSLNEKGDTVYVSGSVTSQHGSTFTINVTSYNEFYYEPTPPKPKEEKELMIDSVSITYMREESDSVAQWHKYSFNFAYLQDYPNVMFEAYLREPGKLVEGTYSLANDSLENPILFQNQSDFEEFFFFGDNYAFNAVSLTLTELEKGVWEYQVDMRDTVGSHYYFMLRQKPDIIIYPEIDPIPEEDKPYLAESQEPTAQEVTFSSMWWNDETMLSDGIIEIQLLEDGNTETTQTAGWLAMLVSKDVEPGTYPVAGTDETETFMASLGYMYGIHFPSYWATVDASMIMSEIWYIVSGEITIKGNAQSGRSMEGTVYSYFGSSLKFQYTSAATGLNSVQNSHKAVKTLRNGHILIERNGKRYSIMGVEE